MVAHIIKVNVELNGSEGGGGWEGGGGGRGEGVGVDTTIASAPQGGDVSVFF